MTMSYLLRIRDLAPLANALLWASECCDGELYLSELRFLTSVLTPSWLPGSLTEMLASTRNSACSILPLAEDETYIVKQTQMKPAQFQ